MNLDAAVMEAARAAAPMAERLLRQLIRIPADYVDRPPAEGGDPECGLSNHEGPRLDLLRRKIVELEAVDGPEDVGFDAFGNLVWEVTDPDDGVAPDEKIVVLLDGHTDTVKALRSRWRDHLGPGIDAYEGLIDPAAVDVERLERELGYLPPPALRGRLIAGRGAADQLGGVVCQVIATRIARALRPMGALRGVILRSIATVAEEDNDGGGPMAAMAAALADGRPRRLPDAVILTEGTGHATEGALGIYRGQRGRMQIQVEIIGRSCHGSMPSEGLNPLEFGAALIAEAAEQARQGEVFLDDPFLGRGSRTASWAQLETPSDCAVPERFVVRFDRRLTAGEDPRQALAQIETLPAVARARAAGLTLRVSVPTYVTPTWCGAVPGNPQIYPGWVTPAGHPALETAVATYRAVCTPLIEADEEGGGLRRHPRVSRWIFSTDGVGFPQRPEALPVELRAAKRWVEAGPFVHPPMFGIGPGIEHNTHKIGECVDGRELPLVAAFYARFPSRYRDRLTP